MKDIIKNNCNKVRAIIKNLTGSYNEDLEQEVYIKTYKNLDKYNEQNKFSNWICTIARNLCKDYLKSAAFKFNNNQADEECLENLKSTQTPEKIYTSKERQKIILKAIDSLPKKLKEVIILYEFEDYSYEKIAQKLNIPQGTVKSRINSARNILKENLSFLLGEI